MLKEDSGSITEDATSKTKWVIISTGGARLSKMRPPQTEGAVIPSSEVEQLYAVSNCHFLKTITEEWSCDRPTHRCVPHYNFCINGWYFTELVGLPTSL
jgi:hypothetical protein